MVVSHGKCTYNGPVGVKATGVSAALRGTNCDRAVCWSLLTCVLVSCLSCAPRPTPVPTLTPTPVPTLTPVPATLRLNVTPAGARVWVNGEQKGLTPAVFLLLPGLYAVQVQSEGYASWQRDVELLPGQDMVIADTLQDVAAPRIVWSPIPDSVQAGQPIAVSVEVEDNQKVAGIRLRVDGDAVARSEGRLLEYTWDTSAMTPGDHSLVVEADDDAGNLQQMSRQVRILVQPTPEPSVTPHPVKPAASEVTAYETAITLATYPFEPYLRERINPEYNYRVVWLDRAAYEASNPHPEPKAFRAVVLENRYLSLMFLPDLGGRLYRCIWKATGQNLFYANPVVKPSFWGPLSRDITGETSRCG